MNTPRLVRASLPLALALALSSSLALAADPAPRLQVSNGGVLVDPVIGAPAYQMRVIGPDGRVFEDTHLAGEPLLILPRQFGQSRWVDGTYRYELVPVLGVRERDDSEAAQMPKAHADSGLVRGGTFRAQGGRLYLPGKIGEESAGTRAAPAAARIAPESTRTGTVGTRVQTKPGVVAQAIVPKDQVVPDDMIIQGSACVGLDCVNGESFGFDTVRLKENNTRIAFDDTSASAGFPANDWQLSANESASGGANKFSIEDVTNARTPFAVSGGAPTNSLFIGPSGKIGLGTGTPSLDIQMMTPNTPAVRFEQTGAGNYTPQTWDIGANEANFFVRDLTGGSRLPFRIRPGAPTSSIDISANGNVGIGTNAPQDALHIYRSGSSPRIRLSTDNNGGGVAPTSWGIDVNRITGRLRFTDDPLLKRVPFKIEPLAKGELLWVGVSDADVVDVNGDLNVTGDLRVTGSVGPDYVFAPGFALPSIDEHAAYMTENRHLPKVGAAEVDQDGKGVMNLGTLSHGMLEELEYAHLYIADLDRTVDTLQQRLDARDAQVQALLDEVKAIRAELDAK